MSDRLKQRVRERQRNVSFWFVRHGQSEGNVLHDQCLVMNDLPLNAKGKEEATWVARYLKTQNPPITEIYTSPLGRSHQTAQIIAHALGLAVQTKNNLQERNWGTWADMNWFQAAEKLKHMPMHERYTFVPDGGESWEQMEHRLLAALEEIATESASGENVLIVTHRGCLRAILPVLAKAAKERHEEFSMKTGSITKFSFDKDDFDFIGLDPKNV